MLKIGVVDDHKLVRRSLSLLVNTFEGFSVALEADHGKDLLEQLKTIAVDVILLDIQMPVMDGYETCTVLKRLYPDLKIMIVSQLKEKETIHKILACGAHGYITKGSDANQLESAILNIYNNGYYFDPAIGTLLHEIIFWDKKPKKTDDPLSSISEKELSIIKFVAKGLTNKLIADKLFINIRTVETYRKRIMEKTATKNFTAVILLALKYHYIAIEDI